MRFVTTQLQTRRAGASPQIDQGLRIARIAMGTRPHKSGAAPNAAFFNALCEIDFSLQACTFFAGGIPRTETLLRQPPGAHYPKKKDTGFRAQERFHP